MTAGARNILLIADDFAISEGVSEGIGQLGRAHRISGTGALVTLERWSRDGIELANLRHDIAIGLHINLTLGAPLGPMPKLAPNDTLPAIGNLIQKAVSRRLDCAEMEAEIGRQLARFADVTGHRPDFIDGHQHVHALPVIRDALIRAITTFYRDAAHKPLVRVPSDKLRALLMRPRARSKAMLLSALSAGFRNALVAAELPANDSFAGVTGFSSSDEDVRRDFSAALNGAASLHLVMCHPGRPSDELAALDPITTRRAVELDVLNHDNAITQHLCHPQRDAADGSINWVSLAAGS